MHFQQRGIGRFMTANRNRLLHFGHIYWPKSVPVWAEKIKIIKVTLRGRKKDFDKAKYIRLAMSMTGIDWLCEISKQGKCSVPRHLMVYCSTKAMCEPLTLLNWEIGYVLPCCMLLI